MRQPVISRSSRRKRQQRLLRTAVLLVFGIATVAVAVSLLGNGSAPEQELPTPTVAFAGTFAGYAEQDPPEAAVQERGEEIVALLDRWYQEGFVDVDGFGDETFPGVVELLDGDARARFEEDRDTLTIGPAAAEVARVEPDEATADVSIYFNQRNEPLYASARIAFAATGTMRDDAAYPLRIEQRLTAFFRYTDDGWLVSTYYDAQQTQDSIVPQSPSPTESPA